MSSTSSNPLPLNSILRTLAAAPPSRDRQHVARQLARLDPKQFLANLQLAAVGRSPQAISALKADMRELEQVFYTLSRAGHDVSNAQRDFRMLQHFVSQLAASEKRHPPPVPHSHHQRASSLPNTVPPSQEQFRPRSGSSREPENGYSTRHYHDPRYTTHSSSQAGLAPRSTSNSLAPSSRSSSSSGSSNTSSSSLPVLSPIPNRLTKPRRMSAPEVVPPARKVHFATHATVYSYRPERTSVVPPARPACLPRAGSSIDNQNRPLF